MFRNLLFRIARRPHKWARLVASGIALVVNLKQLSEITTPDGVPLRGRCRQAHALLRLIAMETHSLQEHLGLDHGNPAWALRKSVAIAKVFGASKSVQRRVAAQKKAKPKRSGR